MRLPLSLIIRILFFYFFFPISFSSSSHLCLGHQSSALLQLKRSFLIRDGATEDPSGYPKVRSWKPDTDCCSWDGVTCHGDTGRVIRLELSSSLLYGSIDSKSTLFHLRDLQVLNLADNHFNYSQIPSAFGRLINLTHLNLSYSVFSGQIPLQISQLVKLVSFDLSRNEELKLESPNLRTLTQNLSYLRELHLDGVNMSAEVNRDWCKTLSFAHPDLRELSLAGCSLLGHMDDSLLKLHFLSELSLANNNFSSIIPDFLGNLTSLTFLDLSDCEFFGKLPRNIFQLPNLQSLFIGSNLFDMFPEFPEDSVLQNLDVSNTNLIGKLPNSIGNLKFLKNLNLNNCNFSGLIPSSLSNLTQLIDLDLSSNNFEGAVHSSLFFLPSLLNLDLSHNNLARIIHSSQFFIPTLQNLDLSSNNFSGSIPSLLTNLTQLIELDLSNNSFEGAIHSSLFFLSSLLDLDLSRNQLTTINEDLHTVNSSSVSLLRQVDLYENRFKGTIPRLVFHLTSLEVLDISSNDFNESVDFNMLQNFKNLTFLDISYNNFSISNNNGGNFTFPQLQRFYAISCNFQEFPIFLKNQTHLHLLSLSSNRINGKIPKWIWKPDMYVLNLSRNLISGLESPPSMCNAINIEILDLSNNQLSGKIPECPGTFGQSLDILNLGENKFNGTIPQICVNGSYISWLNINNNQLEGQLPRSLANCSWLEVLDLGNNKINDTFPFWLENLTNLRVLVLRSNKFHGSIKGPRTSHAFPMLHIIDLSFNNFTGSLPSEYFKCWKAMMMVHKDSPGQENTRGIYIRTNNARYYLRSNNAPYYIRSNNVYYQVKVMIKGQEMEFVRILNVFTTIDLSYNRFQWEIPEVIGDLTLLKVLNLSGNCLTGKIPSSLGHLIQLESLDLSRNQFSGKIPLQLTNLTFLSFLNLSQNQLVGPIPGGKQFDTFENTSYEGNSGLCGFPLSRTCGTIDSTSAPASKAPQQNQDSTTELDFKFLFMGYGCGVIMGFIIGGQVPSWRIDGFFKITSRKRGLKLKKGSRKTRQHGRGE